MTNTSVRWSFPGKVEPFRKSGHARSILTSSASSEAYTPPHILNAGRHALGGVIDLDPCSNEIANEEVRALRILTKEDDGLEVPWFADGEHGTVWCNPPGGFLDRKTLKPAVRGMSSACAWWYELLEYYRAGIVTSALYYTFRLDVLQNIQAEPGYEPPHAFPFCIFGERPRHYSAETPKHERGQVGQPTHACAAFFLPERHVSHPHYCGHSEALQSGADPATFRFHGRHGPSVDRFRGAFEPLGYVRI